MSIEAMERGEIIVYGVAHKHQYIARFDDLGWITWPARENGWAERTSGKESDVDPERTLPDDNAKLALRLSGVSL